MTLEGSVHQILCVGSGFYFIVKDKQGVSTQCDAFMDT